MWWVLGDGGFVRARSLVDWLWLDMYVSNTNVCGHCTLRRLTRVGDQSVELGWCGHSWRPSFQLPQLRSTLHACARSSMMRARPHHVCNEWGAKRMFSIKLNERIKNGCASTIPHTHILTYYTDICVGGGNESLWMVRGHVDASQLAGRGDFCTHKQCLRGWPSVGLWLWRRLTFCVFIFWVSRDDVWSVCAVCIQCFQHIYLCVVSIVFFKPDVEYIVFTPRLGNYVA